MEELINAIKDTPIPTLLIVVGLIFILLGVVNKIHVIEIQSPQRPWAIILGIFLLFIGLALNYYTNQEVKKFVGNDAPYNDIAVHPSIPEKQCIDLCKKHKSCVAVVVSPEDGCWLKSKLQTPFTINSSRTIIDVK
jgi:energy-coupling factor transporter transmembrane protein EcfT